LEPRADRARPAPEGAGRDRGSVHDRAARRWVDMPARQKRAFDRREGAAMSQAGTGADISPVELEIIHNALTAAAAEMDVTVWRTSRSTIVRELLDYSTAIFDRDGWNVAQAARIPSHLNSMSYFLTEILAKHLPPDQWQPDDIVISNDPYCGGQHLPDIVA